MSNEKPIRADDEPIAIDPMVLLAVDAFNAATAIELSMVDSLKYLRVTKQFRTLPANPDLTRGHVATLAYVASRARKAAEHFDETISKLVLALERT